MERRRDNATGIGRAARADDKGLCALRADFPQFRIWPEITGARTLYIARRLRRNTHPHTLVTSDLNELRAALSEDPDNTRSRAVSWAREVGPLKR